MGLFLDKVFFLFSFFHLFSDTNGPHCTQNFWYNCSTQLIHCLISGFTTVLINTFNSLINPMLNLQYYALVLNLLPFML